MKTEPGVGGAYDLIVVGSGIAGLYAALLAAPSRRVLLVTKGHLEESNTRYAQGGIAVAIGPGDSPELHQRDTLVAGDGLCDPHAVAVLTREAGDCIGDLLDRGVAFDREGGELAWTREAAHSLPRVLHAGGDATGAKVEMTLARAVREAGVTVLENALATRLILTGGAVSGVTLLVQGTGAIDVSAPWVILATGGAGQLFARSTNPSVATGDGIALAYRAGAVLADIEFVQFHPTALVLEGAPSFLISEAVRGEGGILRDARGRAFMADYHADRELAPRDVVARAIHSEMMKSGSPNMWLDVTHLPAEKVERRFPTIVRFCREQGIDPLDSPIPVAPAAHYLMGGVLTDDGARTTVPGLLACGEVACTGVHGANRLASNSLLEGLVFARRAIGTVESGARVAAPLLRGAIFAGDSEVRTGLVAEPAFREELRDTMWREASVVRSRDSLLSALDALEAAWSPGRATSIAEHEVSNLALVGSLLLQSALLREESRGGHFRSDFPHADPAWLQRIAVSRDGICLVPLTGLVESHA